jgi:hypothetical protein
VERAVALETLASDFSGSSLCFAQPPANATNNIIQGNFMTILCATRQIANAAFWRARPRFAATFRAIFGFTLT